MKLIIFLVLSLTIFALENENSDRVLCGCGSYGSCSCGSYGYDYDEYSNTPVSPCKPAIPIQPTNTSVNTSGPANCSCSCNCTCFTCVCDCSCIIIPSIPQGNTSTPNNTCPSKPSCPCRPPCWKPCDNDDGYFAGGHWIAEGIEKNSKLRNEFVGIHDDNEDLQNEGV